MAEEDRRERKGEPPAVLGGCRPPPGAGAIRGDDVGIVPRRFVNVTPMSGADGGDLLLGAIVGAKHLEEEAAGVGGEICREDRTGDEARDGDQEDAGEPSQATWHASMVPADLMGHKSVAPASEGSVERLREPTTSAAAQSSVRRTSVRFVDSSRPEGPCPGEPP